jgi:predicted phage replisome organizer
MSVYNKTQMYFFKFPNTFFDSDEIEDILNDYDGDSTIILYLRLITLVTNKMGYLCKIISGELKPYTIEEISKKTKLEIDDVKRKLERLKEVGLIEYKDDLIYIENALSFTNQTVGAKKKQHQRAKRADNCPPDIEIEEEPDVDIDTRNNSIDIDDIQKMLDTDNQINNSDLYCAFLEYCNKQFDRKLSMNERETLRKIVNIYEPKEIKLCIDEAVYKGKISMGYVNGILENRLEWGCEAGEM